jgi:hypothetical protein
MKKLAQTLLFSMSRLAFAVISGNGVKMALAQGMYVQAMFATAICTLCLGWVLHDLLTSED